MPVADFSAIDVLWICLSIFLLIVGVSLAVMFFRLGSTAQRLTSLLGGVEEKAVPLIEDVNGTVERMNEQLDKADIVTTSAVDAVSAVDSSVRTVAGVVSWPVRKLSSFTTGVRHGSASLRAEQDVSRAYEAGLAAAKRRASDIAEDLSESEPRASTAGPGSSLAPDVSWMGATDGPETPGAAPESGETPSPSSHSADRGTVDRES
jgi:uncharacterized protein YoxC